MKYVDLIVQTLLVGVAIFVGIRLVQDNEVMLLLALQFVVGCWQVLISIISLVRDGSASPRKYHLHYSAIYLTVLILGSTVISTTMHVAPIAPPYRHIFEFIAAGYLFGPPWILAIYHYTVSWKLVFNRHKKSSNFLPHINF